MTASALTRVVTRPVTPASSAPLAPDTLKKKAIWVVAGIVLYAVTDWASSFASTANSELAGSLRPGVAIPMMCGLVAGPVAGFLVGFFGNLLGDGLSGYLSVPSQFGVQALFGSFLLHWQVGNGLFGLIPGLAAVRRWQFRQATEVLRALALGAVGLVAGLAIAAGLAPYGQGGIPLGDPGYWDGTLDDVFLPLVVTNTVNMIVVLPVLLFNYERFDPRKLGERAGSVLIRRMLLAVCVAAAMPIAILGLFLVERELVGGEGRRTLLMFQLGATVVMTSFFVLSSAVVMGRGVADPLLRLRDAAAAMERDELSSDQAEELKSAEGDDEVAQLSRTFGAMALEVLQRERALRAQVQKLEIIIDERKRIDQVGEIVETDFFKDLKANAQRMRERANRTATPNRPDQQHSH